MILKLATIDGQNLKKEKRNNETCIKLISNLG